MEYEARKREEMVGVGETVLSFFMGRRRTSAATTIARRRRMTTKVKMEIEETKEEIDEIKEETEKLENELKNQVDEIVNKWEKAQNYLTTKEIKPRRKDVRIQLVALTWIPIWFIKHRAGKFQKISKIFAYQKFGSK